MCRANRFSTEFAGDFQHQHGRDRLLSMKSAAIIGGVFLAFCAGCSTTLSGEQREWLQSAEEAYELKQYNRSIEYSSRFLEQVLDAPEATKALYYKALSEAYSGQRGQAYEDLQHVVTLEGYPELKWRAHAALGTLHYEDGEWNEAARSYADAAAKMSNLPPKDLVLYRQGVCLQRAGRWQEAQRPFEDVIAEFPDGTYAQQAEAKLATRADYYAIKLAEYAMPDTADNYAFRLEQEGLHPYIREVRTGTQRRFVVLTGGFAKYDDARVELARMRAIAPDAEIWP